MVGECLLEAILAVRERAVGTPRCASAAGFVRITEDL
jgi:hypothetical protein